MEIILNSINGGARFVFPSLPAEVTVKNGANYQSYKIIGLGAVKIPKGTNSEEISWESSFYGPSKMREPMMQTYQAPQRCVRILENFRDSGTPLRLMVTGTGINRDVTVSDFQWTPYGGHGNIRYQIAFAQWRDLRVKVLKEADTKTDAPVSAVNNVEDTPEERPEPAPPKTYTIVSGDTLWAIAQRNYGAGTDWQKIYNDNRDVIEAAARSHGFSSSDNGNRIWPGTTLTIPT